MFFLDILIFVFTLQYDGSFIPNEISKFYREYRKLSVCVHRDNETFHLVGVVQFQLDVRNLEKCENTITFEN